MDFAARCTQQMVLSDIPRQDQSDNDVPALPGYQYPDKTQQNNLMPDPYVSQGVPQTSPRLPTGSDPYEAPADTSDEPASDSTIGVPESIGSEPYAHASALESSSAVRAGQALGIEHIESELSDEVGEDAIAPDQQSGEENTVYPMDDTPEDDEQELNELYDASREDNNLGSPGSTTTGTPNLNQHAAAPATTEEASQDDPDAPDDGSYPDMVHDDPLGEDATTEDMLLLGDSDGAENEVPQDPENPLVSAEVKNREVRGIGDAETKADDVESSVLDTLAPTMEPQNGEGMQTPLGVDATPVSKAGILRDPYANKKPKDSKEEVASLEYPEEDDEPQLLLDPDGTEFQTEVNSDGTQEEDPYTYDMDDPYTHNVGDEEVSADDTGTPGGEHEDPDAVSDSDIQGLSAKEKNVLFDSLSSPGSVAASHKDFVSQKDSTSMAAKALASASAVPFITLGENSEREQVQKAIQQANAKTWNTLKKVVNQFTRGKALVDEEQGAITFSTDVQGLAFVAALGLAGLKMMPYKPGQVVREGRDTVHQAVLPGGARLVFNFDVRGFLDKVVLAP